MSSDEQIYWGREQTLVKHIILQRYLVRLAVIVGSWAEAVSYVDCFSGPWENKSEDCSDTSFGIAVGELLKAQAELFKQHKAPRFRCFFLERDKKAFAKLESFCSGVSGLEAVARNSDLERSVSEIQSFYHQGGENNFAFTFIDPTGWTGFEMDVIRPLLQHKPGEVLINYMTSFIRRFIESQDPKRVANFDKL